MHRFMHALLDVSFFLEMSMEETMKDNPKVGLTVALSSPGYHVNVSKRRSARVADIMFRFRRAINNNMRLQLHYRPIPEKHFTFSLKNDNHLFEGFRTVPADRL